MTARFVPTRKSSRSPSRDAAVTGGRFNPSDALRCARVWSAVAGLLPSDVNVSAMRVKGAQ